MHYINLIRCLKFTRESQSKYKRTHRVHWLPDSRDEWKIKKLGRTESFIKPFARNMNSQCNCIVSRELFKNEICQLFFFWVWFILGFHMKWQRFDLQIKNNESKSQVTLVSWIFLLFASLVRSFQPNEKLCRAFNFLLNCCCYVWILNFVFLRNF